MSAPRGYTALPGGYSYALLRVGMVVRNPAGKDVYCQPGDVTAALLATVEALEEATDGIDPTRAAMLADMALGEYF